MCVVSMIGDHYRDKWAPILPGPASPMVPFAPISPFRGLIEPEVSRQEFDDLKKEVLEMKALLKRAIKYDKDNHQAGCEIDDKMGFLRKVAAIVGVSLDDVLGKKKRAPRKAKARSKK